MVAKHFGALLISVVRWLFSFFLFISFQFIDSGLFSLQKASSASETCKVPTEHSVLNGQHSTAHTHINTITGNDASYTAHKSVIDTRRWHNIARQHWNLYENKKYANIMLVRLQTIRQSDNLLFDALSIADILHYDHITTYCLRTRRRIYYKCGLGAKQ